MLKWELKEKYDVQDEKYKEIMQGHDDLVKEAQQKVKSLLVQKEQLLVSEFENGEDKSTERAALTAQIEKAKKELAEAQETRIAAHHFATSKAQDGRITVRDLTLDWVTNYVPLVQEQELTPIIERMKQARDAYYKTLVEYCEFMEEYSPIYEDTRARESKDARLGDGIGVCMVSNPRDLPLVVDYSGMLSQESYRNELVRRLKGGK